MVADLKALALSRLQETRQPRLVARELNLPQGTMYSLLYAAGLQTHAPRRHLDPFPRATAYLDAWREFFKRRPEELERLRRGLNAGDGVAE